MKFNHLGAISLGIIVCSSPLLLAQFDPMANPASQTQANRPQQQLPSTTAMQDSGPNAGDVGQIMQDKMFLRKAAEGGIAEVKLGQLAAQKGSSDEVKTFGQKMVDDHTRINLEMAHVADSMGVMLPKSMNKDDQAEYDKLNALSGNDFDMEYLAFMVKDHHKDLHEFRMEAASPTDPALHEAVVKAQSIIHDHTVMVDKLAREKGVPMPVRGGNHPAPAPTL
jgi:putative membrane protein